MSYRYIVSYLIVNLFYHEYRKYYLSGSREFYSYSLVISALTSAVLGKFAPGFIHHIFLFVNCYNNANKLLCLCQRLCFSGAASVDLKIDASGTNLRFTPRLWRDLRQRARGSHASTSRYWWWRCKCITTTLPPSGAVWLLSRMQVMYLQNETY